MYQLCLVKRLIRFIASARAALADWRALSYVERAAYLHKAADILVRDC
ncbi:hypothetical protein [Streptococcus equi]|nr:hypothetical protein [Streptococcus equi]